LNALASSFGPGPGDGDVIGRIADAISRDGYSLTDGAVPPAMLDALFVHLCGLTDAELSRAGVGREKDFQLNRFVRTDETCWLEAGHPASAAFLGWMEQLRLGLRQRLFLGLFDYEAHYARYAPGAFYRKHRDAFADGASNRVLSTVLYLNPGWKAEDGGEIEQGEGEGERLRSVLGLAEAEALRRLRAEFALEHAVAYALDEARRRIAKAQASLSVLPAGPARDALHRLAGFVLSRRL
jgi:SM-20-related protein